jgi:hypothetical protein
MENIEEIEIGKRFSFQGMRLIALETLHVGNNPCQYCALYKFKKSERIGQCPYILKCIATKRKDRLSVIFRREIHNPNAHGANNNR